MLRLQLSLIGGGRVGGGWVVKSDVSQSVGVEGGYLWLTRPDKGGGGKKSWKVADIICEQSLITYSHFVVICSFHLFFSCF